MCKIRKHLEWALNILIWSIPVQLSNITKKRLDKAGSYLVEIMLNTCRVIQKLIIWFILNKREHFRERTAPVIFVQILIVFKLIYNWHQPHSFSFIYSENTEIISQSEIRMEMFQPIRNENVSSDDSFTSHQSGANLWRHVANWWFTQKFPIFTPNQAPSWWWSHTWYWFLSQHIF